MRAPSVSVILASHGGPDDISLKGADEVIVVGPSAADRADVVEGQFRKIESDDLVGQRVNIGISLASSEWIVVLGGTEKLSTGWLFDLKTILNDRSVCAHLIRPHGGGVPILAVQRQAFAYGSLDGRIDHASEAMLYWLRDIFPHHKHRVLDCEGSAEHDAAWFSKGADPAGNTSSSDNRVVQSVGGYDPRTFWETGGRGWVKWEAYQPDEPEIREIVERVRPASVLELGCGGGRNGRYFAVAAQYVGLDISLPLLERARSRPIDNGIGLVCGDATRLPFSNATFDLVFAVSTIQHVQPERISECIADIVRVSRQYICLIEFVEELPGRTNWFAQPHMFRHDYLSLMQADAAVLLHRPTALQIQPAIKHAFLFKKRS